MKLFIVHAFTQKLFGGNPAGVAMLGDDESYPRDEEMRRIAAELRYSETVFLKRLSQTRHQARYFTPVAEVNLCGHATIAAAHSLLESGSIGPTESLVFETRAGDLNITLEDGQIWMDMAPPRTLAVIAEREKVEELYLAFGLSAEGQGICTAKAETGLVPTVVSAGLPDILLPVKDRVTLGRMQPDFQKVASLSERYGAVGVHAFALDPADGGIFARNFAPLLGIEEEAATGTGNGALAAYLHQRGLLAADTVHQVIQGEDMGRASAVLVRVRESDRQAVAQVGGYAVTFIEGQLLTVKPLG